MAGRYLARLGVGALLQVPPATIEFSIDAFGRVELSQPTALETVSFSISHTLGLTVCAITRGMMVGIDVEPLARADAMDELVRRFLHPSERRVLTGLDDQRRGRMLLEHWVCKEAYTKACGRGINLAFEKIQIQPLSGTAVRFVHDDPAIPPRDMQLLRPVLSETHVAAVVAATTTRLPTPRILNARDASAVPLAPS